MPPNALLIPLKSPWGALGERAHRVGFLFFQPKVKKLLNIEQFIHRDLKK